MQRAVTNDHITSRYLAYKMAVTSARDEGKDMKAALALLRSGTVSTELVNFERLDQSYEEVSCMPVAGFRKTR